MAQALDVFAAVASDDVASLVSFLDSTSSADCASLRDESGGGLLHCACRNGSIGCARELLRRSDFIDPNADDASGRTPLHYAADLYRDDTTGNLAYEEIFQILVDGGCVAVTDASGKLPDVVRLCVPAAGKLSRRGAETHL